MQLSEIEIGQRVVIVPSSSFCYQFTRYAEKTTGTIVSDNDYYPREPHSSWIYVKFDNGYGNCYHASDLKLVTENGEGVRILIDTTCKTCGATLDLIDEEECLYECPNCLLLSTDEGILYNAAI